MCRMSPPPSSQDPFHWLCQCHQMSYHRIIPFIHPIVPTILPPHTYIHLSCKHLRLKAIAWIQDERMYEQDERSNEQIQLHEIVIWTTHTHAHTQPNSHTRSSQVYPWYSHVCLLVLYPFEANVTMCLRALVCVAVCENVCVCSQVNKLEYLKYLSAGIEQWFTIDEIENVKSNGKFTKWKYVLLNHLVNLFKCGSIKKHSIMISSSLTIWYMLSLESIAIFLVKFW